MDISPSLHWTFHLLWNVSLLLPSLLYCTLRKILTIFHCISRNHFLESVDLHPNARIAIQHSVLVLQTTASGTSQEFHYKILTDKRRWSPFCLSRGWNDIFIQFGGPWRNRETFMTHKHLLHDVELLDEIGLKDPRNQMINADWTEHHSRSSLAPHMMLWMPDVVRSRWINRESCPVLVI